MKKIEGFDNFSWWKKKLLWPENEIIEKWITDRVAIKREILINQNVISREDYKKVIKEIKSSESKILSEFFWWDSDAIVWDYHLLETDLTRKNKFILKDVLYDLGLLYAYQNEDDKEKLNKWIDILDLGNSKTDKSKLKIHIRRKSSNTPFYIEKIEIIEDIRKKED